MMRLFLLSFMLLLLMMLVATTKKRPVFTADAAAWTTPTTRRRRYNRSFITITSLHNKNTMEDRGICETGTNIIGSVNNNILIISDRRTSLERMLVMALSTVSVATLIPDVADATSAKDNDRELYTRRQDSGQQQFAYEFLPPADCKAGNKPLKTHLDEINFISSSTSGYQYGITVDPVRINSLKEFGTPEEVAAKVVLAEVNRDGVFDVKLMEDPIAGTGTNSEYYQLNYRSTGKRGIKRFVSKFVVQDHMLYALTAQCKEEDYYPNLENEMKRTANTFKTITI